MVKFKILTCETFNNFNLMQINQISFHKIFLLLSLLRDNHFLTLDNYSLRTVLSVSASFAVGPLKSTQ